MTIHADEDTDLLRRYFADIEDSTPLSREREVELSARIHKGDMAARDELASANLRFVVDVARQYQSRGLSMAELVAAGNVGLMKAADRFDGERGFKFISYAVWWIRQSIMQTLTDQTRTVRVPVTRQNLLRDISRIRAKLGEEGRRNISTAEIAEELGVAEAEILETMMKGRPEASLDLSFEEGDERNLMSVLADEAAASPDEGVMDRDGRARIDAVLETLDERESYICRCYYGLDGEEPLTLEQIGGLMSLTRERVRQLKERALSRLRDPKRYRSLPELAEAMGVGG
ncbi:MAG: RNA polymerase sigma factor RpoD/SigA [Gemmatimonadetes bacterium]|nr:RNA polymerase sigma factor RpoD/SigA [Gemmatimonadota bacterium]MBT4609551.1 RNA polymerase sigma factor RpoD/SigA [Gemmatimonadota bacterium]MBT5060137.1 RNA polymerase sigma factor RpoD/SigA [Gemmatimonadota bacterium]MBT5588768.1 RNA polymerase sigma factor RpoD/SigA [Gemmatimonadota bacterium]MBT5964514.1 RNA polymerase sigma factor RpoD/SigA [Gemmatimonadota bacterium]